MLNILVRSFPEQHSIFFVCEKPRCLLIKDPVIAGNRGDLLVAQFQNANRYFVEIGASDGLENNTTWLALVRRYGGLWIEGDSAASQKCREMFSGLNYGVAMETLFVTLESTATIVGMTREKDPDLFSMDIDGNDYHVTESLFKSGLRPKVCVVEYNSAFGPDLSVTVPYVSDFRVGQGERANLFSGCSIQGWRKLFSRHGYAFLTVDANGVNAFFARPEELASGFLERLKPREFAENTSQGREYGQGWDKQLAMIDTGMLQEIA